MLNFLIEKPIGLYGLQNYILYSQSFLLQRKPTFPKKKNLTCSVCVFFGKVSTSELLVSLKKLTKSCKSKGFLLENLV
jgi:hypothetical protein